MSKFQVIDVALGEVIDPINVIDIMIGGVQGVELLVPDIYISCGISTAEPGIQRFYYCYY